MNYFNPIIGLILTLLDDGTINLKYIFQSHYRSDFNTETICTGIVSFVISIPL